MLDHQEHLLDTRVTRTRVRVCVNIWVTNIPRTGVLNFNP